MSLVATKNKSDIAAALVLGFNQYRNTDLSLNSLYYNFLGLAIIHADDVYATMQAALTMTTHAVDTNCISLIGIHLI